MGGMENEQALQTNQKSPKRYNLPSIKNPQPVELITLPTTYETGDQWLKIND